MFHFKKFSIVDDRSSMKVGTDAILLGSWAARGQRPRRILDVGTGSGVVALMLAQRFPEADVVGIDIHRDSILQAEGNFAASPWPGRLEAIHSCLQDYEVTERFDLIVTNPPWFERGLRPPDASRAAARHDLFLSLNNLPEECRHLLSSAGRLSLILPFRSVHETAEAAAVAGFHPARKCIVCPKPEAPPHRVLLEFTRVAASTLDQSELTVEIERHTYSPEYSQLARDFLLKL